MPHRPSTFSEPILFFLCQKEKNGFGLPRKERGHGANRSPKFDSETFGLKLSVALVPTVRKSAPLCSRLSEGGFQRSGKEAGRCGHRPLQILSKCIRSRGTGGQRRPPLQKGRKSNVRHHPDSVRRVVARGEVTKGGQMGPSRVSGHMMAAQGALPVSDGPLFLWRLDTVSFSEGEKEMGSKRGPMWASAPTASEEANCIALPPGRRKLHIRWLLLPFPKANRFTGLAFGFWRRFWWAVRCCGSAGRGWH